MVCAGISSNSSQPEDAHSGGSRVQAADPSRSRQRLACSTAVRDVLSPPPGSGVVSGTMSRLTDTDLRGAEIARADLRAAWLREVDLSGAHIRGANLTGTEIDGEIDGLTIHGIEVAPLVREELDRRHPERAALRAHDAEAFRSGWAGLEAMWAPTIERVKAMPAGTVDLAVDREWSFAQTLRHLVFATDVWLGDAILHREQPCHRYGEPFSGWRDRASKVGIDLDAHPPYQEVLAMRADRVGKVRNYLTSVTNSQLDEGGHQPFFEPHPFTVLDCLRFIINEELQHHRYAVRDLDLITARDTQRTHSATVT
jgi:DinB superfamily/Pentapeptide repeats (8 copies)